MIALEVNFGGLEARRRPSKKALDDILRRASRRLHVAGKPSVSLAFVDKKEMARMNRVYHGGRGVTDVLSFPSSDDELKGYLGEIVIHEPEARLQAKAAGHSVKKEVRILFAHGLLHLLGYDHDTPKKEAQMFALQDSLCRP